ncbi:MAG: hypothetical protein ACFFDP_07260 [Promethearchaeota archaeon]
MIIPITLILQYFDDLYFAILAFIFVVLVAIICTAIQKSKDEKNKQRTIRRRPSQRHRVVVLPSEPTPPRPLIVSRTSWSGQDVSSSPIGGTCLKCGAVFHEETLSHCSKCGAERQRCPICQRFIAGGQELLACPHCQVLGHANELIEWIERHESCPYCARKITKDELLSPEDLSNYK